MYLNNRLSSSDFNIELSKKIALALSILHDLLKNKRVFNILANLWAYFNNRRYFPILMLKFDHDIPHNHIYLIKDNQNQRNRPEHIVMHIIVLWPIHLKKNSSWISPMLEPDSILLWDILAYIYYKVVSESLWKNKYIYIKVGP